MKSSVVNKESELFKRQSASRDFPFFIIIKSYSARCFTDSLSRLSHLQLQFRLPDVSQALLKLVLSLWNKTVRSQVEITASLLLPCIINYEQPNCEVDECARCLHVHVLFNCDDYSLPLFFDRHCLAR